MKDTHKQGQGFARGPLFGAAALVLFSIVVIAGARVSDIGTLRTPEPSPVESRQIKFQDREDGAVVVRDARRGMLLAILEPGTNGFIRGAMRALVRERRQNKIGPDEPFTLLRSGDGRLTLTDPATGRRVDLNAFGPANAGAFAQLINPGRQIQ